MIELPISYFIALFLLFVACVRILHMNSQADWPELFANGSSIDSLIKSLDREITRERELLYEQVGYVEEILKQAPIFTKPYQPPLLWGKSGHLQTIIHSTLSRHKVPREKGDSRHRVSLSDGTIVTFDIFQPLSSFPHHRIVKEEADNPDVTLLVCPGIGNSSETVALKTFSHHANEQGFRVAVLNHLGVIPDIPLATPRIFNYGGTEEYGAMVDEVRKLYPDTRMIAVGFSMGGNLVSKYLGEDSAHRENFIAGISCCQGYDIDRALQLLNTWKNMGKAYLRAVGVCVEKVLYNFQSTLLSDEILSRFSIPNRDAILSCHDVMEIDEILLSKMSGYRDRPEYYRKSSSAFYIPNIDIPMLFINAKDDPLIPTPLFDVPISHTATNDKAMFVVTKHGGHLGFFECQQKSSLLARGTYTWLDKAIVQYCQAVLKVRHDYVQENPLGHDQKHCCDSDDVRPSPAMI